jgi:hypothetical protein
MMIFLFYRFLLEEQEEFFDCREITIIASGVGKEIEAETCDQPIKQDTD